MWVDYGFVLMGFVAILGSLFGTKFYYGNGEFGYSNRPAPVRSSKVLFFVVGSIFILLGLLDLFGVIAMKRTDW